MARQWIRWLRRIAVTVGVVIVVAVAARAASPLPRQLKDPGTTEGWIWQQVQAGNIADLNDRCGTPRLSVYQDKDPLWRRPAAMSIRICCDCC